MSSTHRTNPRLAIPASVEILNENHTKRARVERFIHDHFKAAYGANVSHYYPELMVLYSQSGQICGALGIRSALSDSLFLEHYLPQSAESTLSKITGCHCSRSEIVEVGNLAVAQPGGARWLITALTAFLYNTSHISWVVFTAVTGLKNSFKHMGVNMRTLAIASAGSLGAESGDWGSYYDNSPVVTVVNVNQSYEAIVGTNPQYTNNLLWHSAGSAGRQAA